MAETGKRATSDATRQALALHKACVVPASILLLRENRCAPRRRCICVTDDGERTSRRPPCESDVGCRATTWRPSPPTDEMATSTLARAFDQRPSSPRPAAHTTSTPSPLSTAGNRSASAHSLFGPAPGGPTQLRLVGCEQTTCKRRAPAVRGPCPATVFLRMEGATITKRHCRGHNAFPTKDSTTAA